MSWLQDIHLVISAILFVIVFVEGRNEDFGLRFCTALLVALFWLPLLVIFAIWMIGDAVDRLMKRVRS